MKKIIASLIAAPVLFACVEPAQAFPFFGKHQSARQANGFGTVVYRATDRMIENMRPRPGNAGIVTPVDQVIVATIVSVDDLDRSSTLGRLTSQLVLNRLTQLGYQARDVTFVRALDISPDGEKILSRDARRLSRQYNASAVVAGTYAVGGLTIFVNLRLLSAEDGSVISSADLEFPLNADTWPLVETKAPRVTRTPEFLIHGQPYPVTRPESATDGERGGQP